VRKEESFYRFHNFEVPELRGEDLRGKLDLSLKHNSKLLDENAALSELVSKLRAELKDLNQQLALVGVNESTKMAKVQTERAALMEELEGRQITHEDEVRRLLDEVSRLHTEKNEL
jgi:predicted nuclease with TOPRIM domain